MDVKIGRKYYKVAGSNERYQQSHESRQKTSQKIRDRATTSSTGALSSSPLSGQISYKEYRSKKKYRFGLENTKQNQASIDGRRQDWMLQRVAEGKSVPMLGFK